MFTAIIPILCNINPCMLFLLSIEKKKKHQSNNEQTLNLETCYSLFILVMCILLPRINNPRDFVKYIGGQMSL